MVVYELNDRRKDRINKAVQWKKSGSEIWNLEMSDVKDAGTNTQHTLKTRKRKSSIGGAGAAGMVN